MNKEIIFELCAAILTVTITVILVILLKRFGRISTGPIGPDLNLLTYGFLWDTILRAVSGKYWVNLPKDIEYLKPLLLIFVIIVNIVLMGWNFRVADNIEHKIGFDTFGHRFLSFFLGLISLAIFMVLKVFLN